MATNFTELKMRVEILERLDDTLKAIERDVRMEWGVISETITDEQATHYRTGELLWEDEEKTIPKYKVHREYDYIPRTEFDEESKIKLDQIESIRKALLKMV